MSRSKPSLPAGGRRAVKVRLLAVAKSVGGRTGFADDCWDHFESFIDGGLDTMEREGVIDDSDKVDEAEANLRRFVMTMRAKATELHLSELHEPTFFGARALLCPVWPFC